MAQTDVTYKIVNPSFEISGVEGWTNTDMVAQTNNSFPIKDGKVYMEKWVSKGQKAGNASLKQTVKNLVKGRYRLTVAAQNIQQDVNEEQTGVTISAKSTVKTNVTKPGDYSLEFDLTTSMVAIAFTASNATGNYICCDNFRLTFLSTDTATVNALITSANKLFERWISQSCIDELKKTISAAQKAIDENAEDLTGVAMALEDATVSAQDNTKAFTNLKALISKAKLLDGKKMGAVEGAEFKKALAEAEASFEDPNYDPFVLTVNLQAAYDKANTSISTYAKLEAAIANAEEGFNSEMIGAIEYNEVINHAVNMYEVAEATTDEILKEIDVLANAKLEFMIANGGTGDGKAPVVKETNHYVPTGATEALMRATFEGDDILEKGVCWSKEHNPTVLDNRTTKYFNLNGTIIHVKGLEPATVYYLRPYVLTKTYALAYGDEVKVVTHPAGTCTWSWDESGPDEGTNNRCRTAVRQTIDYFNEWTGIKGFHLSGHYAYGAGAGDGTADCSYGGWMRISQNTAYQAIGTVLHETGHGVGVGTHPRYSDTNVHNWKWYGREANKIYSFLENKNADPFNSEFCMVGDGTHAWGQSATYDWFVNGASKDTHQEIQYIGGCCLLYGFFIDGLDPNSSEWWTTQHNGISGYTYNFDDNKRYYIMNKNAERGLGSALLYQEGNTTLAWGKQLNGEPITDEAAWTIEYNAKDSYYMFKNVASGKYISHANASPSLKTTTNPTASEYFQLMPDRTDVTIDCGDSKVKTHGYWFTWTSGGFKSLSASAMTSTTSYGKIATATFDFSDNATAQQWIIISEDELELYHASAVASGIQEIKINDSAVTGDKKVISIYSANGNLMQHTQKGLNIIKYSDGSCKKIYVK